MPLREINLRSARSRRKSNYCLLLNLSSELEAFQLRENWKLTAAQFVLVTMQSSQKLAINPAASFQACYWITSFFIKTRRFWLAFQIPRWMQNRSRESSTRFGGENSVFKHPRSSSSLSINEQQSPGTSLWQHEQTLSSFSISKLGKNVFKCGDAGSTWNRCRQTKVLLSGMEAYNGATAHTI